MNCGDEGKLVAILILMVFGFLYLWLMLWLDKPKGVIILPSQSGDGER